MQVNARNLNRAPDRIVNYESICENISRSLICHLSCPLSFLVDKTSNIITILKNWKTSNTITILKNCDNVGSFGALFWCTVMHVCDRIYFTIYFYV